MSQFLRFLRLKYIGRKVWMRNLLWSYLFGSFGKGSDIAGPIDVKRPENVHIGSYTNINPYCVFSAREQIIIGNYVNLSSGVIINSGGLDYSKKGAERTHDSAEVHIENGVWIASGAIINAGVTIGENSVIAAGAVVTKDIPANVIAMGVPAKVVKNI